MGIAVVTLILTLTRSENSTAVCEKAQNMSTAVGGVDRRHYRQQGR